MSEKPLSYVEMFNGESMPPELQTFQTSDRVRVRIGQANISLTLEHAAHLAYLIHEQIEKNNVEAANAK